MTDYSLLDAALAELSHAEADAMGRAAFLTATEEADKGDMRRSAFWHGLGCVVMDAADAKRAANLALEVSLGEGPEMGRLLDDGGETATPEG